MPTTSPKPDGQVDTRTCTSGIIVPTRPACSLRHASAQVSGLAPPSGIDEGRSPILGCQGTTATLGRMRNGQVTISVDAAGETITCLLGFLRWSSLHSAGHHGAGHHGAPVLDDIGKPLDEAFIRPAAPQQGPLPRVSKHIWPLELLPGRP